MLRANSLAAVTIFVWSTSESLIVTACRRTAWRTATISAESVTAIISAFSTGILVKIWHADVATQHLHPFFHIEGRVYAAQVEAELNQGNGYRGLHPNDDRLRVQNPRHCRGIGQHPPDK